MEVPGSTISPRMSGNGAAVCYALGYLLGVYTRPTYPLLTYASVATISRDQSSRQRSVPLWTAGIHLHSILGIVSSPAVMFDQRRWLEYADGARPSQWQLLLPKVISCSKYIHDPRSGRAQLDPSFPADLPRVSQLPVTTLLYRLVRCQLISTHFIHL